MSNTWTPGPWHWWDAPLRPEKYDLAKLASPEKLILGKYGGEGDNALGRTDEDRANARLIAAAPEMAEALSKLIHALNTIGGERITRMAALGEEATRILSRIRGETA